MKKTSIIEPGIDPLYKIYYNQYKLYEEAKKDLKKIRKLKNWGLTPVSRIRNKT